MKSSSEALDIAIDWIRSCSGERLTIGIDGYSGSGKSTLARRIAEQVSDSEVIQYDDLYLPKYKIPDIFSVPLGIAEAYDWVALRDSVLVPFRKGEASAYPRLDWRTQEQSNVEVLRETRCLIVEGVSCTQPALSDLYDFRIWVEGPTEMRLARGIERDGEAMRSQWTDYWMPAEEIYVAAYHPRLRADLLVDGSG